MKRNFRPYVLALAMVAMPLQAHAFGLSGVGGKLGYASPEDLDGTLEVGAHLEFEQSGTRLHFIPGLTYWNSDHVSDLAANADLYYHFVPEGVVTPYVGAGLGIQFVNDSRTDHSSSDPGLNLFGGVRFPSYAAHYFIEGRYTASDVSQFALLGGVTFHTGGR